MMRRSFFLIAVVFLVSVHPIQAHMLKTENQVGAVIHIDPEDDPYVGVPANIYFELKDKTNQFDPRNCNCILSIESEGKVLTSLPLFHEGEPVDLSHASAQYTFPKKGIYTLRLDGAPISGDTFQPFSLEYEIRVAREQETTSRTEPAFPSASQVLKVLIILGLVCSISVIFIIKKRKRSI